MAQPQAKSLQPLNKISKIAVIIPIYNEALFLERFCKELFSFLPTFKQKFQIIFVNDGSVDKTAQILEKVQKKHQFEVLTHQTNYGKGAALRTGTNWAKEHGFQAVIMMDGDCQHRPEHLPEFLKELQHNTAVFGYRNFDHKMSWPRQTGNNFISWLFKNFFVIQRRDPLCGFMAFRIEALSQIEWHSDDYGVEAEISALVGKNQVPFSEVNISTIYLDKKTGFNIHDGIQLLSRLPQWYALQNPWFRFLGRSIKKTKWLLLFFGASLIYVLLSFKYPFQPTSLLGNLEPFPDTLFYSVPAWNVAHGAGWGMFTHQYGTKLITPPLYSLYLVPFFWLIQDVRSYYLANMALGIGSLAVFILILKNITGNYLSSFLASTFAVAIYVTSFYVYTLPSFLLAENITLFLVLVGVWSVVTEKKWISGSIPLLLMFVKFSNFPLSVVFGCWYLAQIFFDKKTSLKEKAIWFSYFISTGVLLVGYILTSGILVGHKNLQSGQSFGSQYFIPNMNFYLRALAGSPTTFLWLHERLISSVVSTVVCISTTIWIYFRPKQRPLAVGLFSLIASTTLFMSFFVTPDTRYVVFSIPLLCLFLAGGIRELLIRKRILGTCLILGTLIVFLFLPQAGVRGREVEVVTLKKQIGLNLKYTETPWHSLAAQEWQEFFDHYQKSSTPQTEVYLGTFLPPYYLHVIGVTHVQVLPITLSQEFFNDRQYFSETFAAEDPVGLYTQKLAEGKPVFISPYYANNLDQWQRDYAGLATHFELKKVYTGCLETCNLYQVLPK